LKSKTWEMESPVAETTEKNLFWSSKKWKNLSKAQIES
jgi:hypothetical protein